MRHPPEFQRCRGETGAARNHPLPVRRSLDFTGERRRPEGRRYNGFEPYLAGLNRAGAAIRFGAGSIASLSWGWNLCCEQFAGRAH
jgi:hypothetical protein